MSKGPELKSEGCDQDVSSSQHTALRGYSGMTRHEWGRLPGAQMETEEEELVFATTECLPDALKSDQG